MKIKKLISMFVALGASLMIASAVSAAPYVEYTTAPLTDDEVNAIFGETLADYDAYMLTISLTPGVDLNTTNTMNPSGLLLGGFETTLAMSAEDLAKIESTGYSASVENVYTPEKDVFAGDGYTFILGNGKKGACFPAKNSTVEADSKNVLTNTVVFVLKGQSVTMTVDKISLNYMQMTNGNQTADTDLDMYNMVNSGEKTITCNTKTITLGTPAGGDDDDDDDTIEKAVQATTSYKTGMTGVLFTAVDGTNKGQYVVRFNGNVEAGNVKVGLKVTGVPSTNNLTITAENYYGTAATGVLK